MHQKIDGFLHLKGTPFNQYCFIVRFHLDGRQGIIHLNLFELMWIISKIFKCFRTQYYLIEEVILDSFFDLLLDVLQLMLTYHNVNGFVLDVDDEFALILLLKVDDVGKSYICK